MLQTKSSVQKYLKSDNLLHKKSDVEGNGRKNLCGWQGYLNKTRRLCQQKIIKQSAMPIM